MLPPMPSQSRSREEHPPGARRKPASRAPARQDWVRQHRPKLIATALAMLAAVWLAILLLASQHAL